MKAVPSLIILCAIVRSDSVAVERSALSGGLLRVVGHVLPIDSPLRVVEKLIDEMLLQLLFPREVQDPDVFRLER